MRFYETQEIQGTLDFLRALEIYYWEGSFPRERPAPSTRTPCAYTTDMYYVFMALNKPACESVSF